MFLLETLVVVVVVEVVEVEVVVVVEDADGVFITVVDSTFDGGVLGASMKTTTNE